MVRLGCSTAAGSEDQLRCRHDARSTTAFVPSPLLSTTGKFLVSRILQM